ncbi:MAG: replicative DNA helicase [Clostridiales bacterium]|jgi:replicative DNA helicase|nr:replicative DNA helicase [Clostridiales bacterium]
MENKITDIDTMNMPYSLEAEQAVLGAILIEPEAITRAIPIIKPDFFYLPQHKAIFSSMVSLDTLGTKIDPLLVLESLRSDGFFDDAEGKNYLYQLSKSVPTSANIELYCKIVRDKFYIRTLITASREIVETATQANADADLLLDAAEQKIYDIRRGKGGSPLQKLSDIIAGEVFHRLGELASDTSEDAKPIKTGLSDLDNIISGLNKSDLLIIGARPGVGKTSIALNIARNIGITGKKVAFFSLEMSNMQLAQRVLATEARIVSEKLQSGNLTPDDWYKLTSALAYLKDCELYFDETANITIPDIKAKVRRQKNIDCVFIDYLGLVASTKRTENKVQEIADITRDLKLMAKDLKIPVICCAQLSRAPEAKSGRASRKPLISDLRDSGSIEQDADIVLLLYREAYYKNEKENPDDIKVNTAELEVAKNRHGPTGNVHLTWNAEYTLFSTRDRRYYDD